MASFRLRPAVAIFAGVGLYVGLHWLYRWVGPYSLHVLGYGLPVDYRVFPLVCGVAVAAALLAAPRAALAGMALGAVLLAVGNATLGYARRADVPPLRAEPCLSSFPRGAFDGINVVVISLDTLRADHLGAYGYARPTSPNIDALAARGVRFESAFASAATTLVSHSTMFTGLRPGAHGAQTVDNSALPDDVRTLAEYLRDAGYATGAVTDGIQLAKTNGFAQGFDHYSDEGGELEVTLPRATAWMDGQRNRPFFLFLHTYAVHTPYGPPPPFDRLFYPDYAGPLPSRIPADMLARINDGRLTITPDDLKYITSLYDGEIRNADRLIGDFLRYLSDSGLARRTIVVLTADHGEELGEHGMVGFHGHTFFDELLHVPFIVSGPGLAPRVARQRVGLVDLTPTLLDLLGVPYDPASFQGVTFAGLLGANACAATDRTIVAELEHVEGEVYGRRQGIVAGPWKFTRKTLEPRLALADRLLGLFVYRTRNKQLFGRLTDAEERRNRVRTRVGIARDLEALLNEADRQDRERLSALEPVKAPPLTPEQIERLRSLGYIGK